MKVKAKNGKVKIVIKESNKGALHEEMGIAEDKKIPAKDLAKEKKEAETTGDTKLMKRVVFAQNARKFQH